MDDRGHFSKHRHERAEPTSANVGARATVTLVIPFEHRNRPFELRIGADGALELHLDRCLRKRRETGPEEPQYVWTNVELEWEEHHYVEARHWASERRVVVTVNGAPLLERVY